MGLETYVKGVASGLWKRCGLEIPKAGVSVCWDELSLSLLDNFVFENQQGQVRL